MSAVRTIASRADFEELLTAPRAVLWCTAEHCRPCAKLFPLVEELAGDPTVDVVCGRLDIDAHPELAAELMVLSLPTAVCFRQGVLTHRVAGRVTAKKLRAAIA